MELEGSLANQLSVNSVSPAEREDAGLVRAAQLNDRAAFGLLYRRYARMVHGILLARVPHTAAEDLVQDVFLQALARLGSLRDVSRFGGWLAAIARNRAADFHRLSRSGDALHQELPEEGTKHHPASERDSGESAAVLDAIRTLPETYRETLILRLVEEMTGPEIAERTGLTHGSVRVNLHRGMKQLRKILSETKCTGAGKQLPGEGRR